MQWKSAIREDYHWSTGWPSPSHPILRFRKLLYKFLQISGCNNSVWNKERPQRSFQIQSRTSTASEMWITSRCSTAFTILVNTFVKRVDSLDFSCKHTHRHLQCCVVLDVSLFLCSDACAITLDPNTADTQLILSDENKKITGVKDRQLYPDHPERFEHARQVLSVESLTGRCYWEAERSGCAVISVSYKGISRKRGWRDCSFGANDKSWSLISSDDGFSVHHNMNSTDIPADRSSSNRVGVYVDVSAGSLSFYSVSDTHTLTRLHTFNTTFTEPLCAGFGVYYGFSVSLCDIKQPPVRIISDPHVTRWEK